VKRFPRWAPLRSESGAMYEINFLVWPLVYGFTGHILGSMWGHPWIGTIVGVILGFFTAVPMISALFYDVEILAPVLLIVSFFVPRSMRLWVLLGLCALPWVRLAGRGVAGLVKKQAGDG
jgi:hypothetical protein